MALSELEYRVGEIGEWMGSSTINFFGRPFAGKDTQAVRFARVWGVPVIGGGDILRASKESITPEIRAVMDAGKLIPSEDYQAIVLPFLSDAKFDKKPLVLSSVGRMQGEEAGVLAATEAAGHPTRVVPFLDITEEETLWRHAVSPNRGRSDDDPDAQTTRLAEFKAQTEPVLTTYEDMGLLLHVDAMQPKDLVFSSLVGLLHERACAD